MQLLKFELRKIWRPGILGALVVIGLIYSYLFLSFSLTYFPNGPQCQCQYDLMKEWTEQYGTTMEALERKDAEKGLKELKKEADQFIKANPVFAEAGYTCYEDTKQFSEEKATEEEKRAKELLFSEESDYIGERIEQREGALFAYDIRYDKQAQSDYTPKEQIYMEQLFLEQKLDGLMPYEVMENIQTYSSWGMIFIILSIFLLLAPAITRDRMGGVRQLQWSSRKGRHILFVQFCAMVLSGFCLAVIELAVFSLLYTGLGTQYFWNNPINSFFYGSVYWYDLTYGQYILSIVAIAAVLSVIVAVITFVLSRYSGNFISLLMKVVPVFVVVAFFVKLQMEGLFSFENTLSSATGITGMEIWSVIVFLLLSIASSIVILKREERCEL